MRIYAYVALAVIIIGALGWGYASAYKSGKDSVTSKLQEQKVEVLKDGKKIDENVLAADDDSLVCLLIDCASDPAVRRSGEADAK
jgi:hypothetical protein